MKKQIKQLDWQPSNYKFLTDNSSWIMPQLFQLLGNIIQPKTSDLSGLLDLELTAQALARSAKSGQLWWEPPGHEATRLDYETLARIMQFVLQAPRGLVLGKLPQSKNLDYSAQHSIGLLACNKQRNLDYHYWDLSGPGLAKFLDPDLAAAVLAGKNLPSSLLDPRYRLELRNLALEIRSGAKVGTLRDPKTCAQVYNCQHDLEFKSLPRLLKLQLLELWVYSEPYTGIKFVPNLEPLGLTSFSTEVLVPPEASFSWSTW